MSKKSYDFDCQNVVKETWSELQLYYPILRSALQKSPSKRSLNEKKAVEFAARAASMKLTLDLEQDYFYGLSSLNPRDLLTKKVKIT